MLRDTKTIDWEVYFVPSHLSELRIGYRLTNIRGLSNDIERWLGLRSRRSTEISLPAQCGRCGCTDLLEATNPTLETTRFSHVGNDVDFGVTLSINSNLTDTIRCISE